jgi:hypothetical protein
VQPNDIFYVAMRRIKLNFRSNTELELYSGTPGILLRSLEAHVLWTDTDTASDTDTATNYRAAQRSLGPRSSKTEKTVNTIKYAALCDSTSERQT